MVRIRVTPNGDNVYEGAKIDYRTSSLRLKDIADILTGEKERLSSGSDRGI